MSGALEGLLNSLFSASFRGVEFHMPDSRHDAGRRVVRFLFPGRDAPVHDDLGLHVGTISVTGLLIGDDYVIQAAALEAAFREPGPGTLVHPWLGELEVVLAQPATLSFTTKELRVARFDATFERWGGDGPAVLDTLSALVRGVGAVRAEARSLLRQVLSPVRLTVAAVAAVQGFAGSLVSSWGRLASVGRGLEGMPGALIGPLRGLAGAGGIATFATTDADYGGRVADRFDAVPLAIAAQAAPALPPAIGAAAGAPPPPVPSDAASAATLLLAGAEAASMTPCQVYALPIVTAIQARMTAAITAGDINFASQPEAFAWRDRVDAALGQAAEDTAVLAQTLPGGAARLWTAIGALRAALAADFNVRIGRLPAVAVLPPRAGAVPVWLLAQHLAGADASRIVPLVDELARRNRLARPGAVEATQRIEYLA